MTERRITPGPGWFVFSTTVVLVAAFAYLIAQAMQRGLPDDLSAEAGFARDMSVHHAQAVEMGEIVRQRTQDPAIRTLATDIVLTQQAQIGRLGGWLDAWGLLPTGTEPPMAWMGHPLTGLMPGMATEEEIESLRTLPPDQMDIRFLDLMIPHHVAGADMSDEIAGMTERDEVKTFATGMSESQRAEIAYMRDLLAERSSRTSCDGCSSSSPSPMPNMG